MSRSRRRFARSNSSAVAALLLAWLSSCAGPQRPPASPRPAGSSELPPPAPASLETAAEVEARLRIRMAQRTLLNSSPEISAQDRLDAARLLFGAGSPEADEALARVLRSRQGAAVVAVVGAMDAVTPPPPAFLDHLVDALATASAESFDPLCLALTRYDDAALPRLLIMAQASDEAPARRLAAIQALGWFTHRDAAAALATMLDPERAEPAPIVESACLSLQRISGVNHGIDAARWRQWWDANRDRPADQWRQLWAQTLRSKLIALEDQLARERLGSEQLASRLMTAMRELYVLMPVPQQLQQLPALLSDELPAVREFAITRVEVLLRDSVRIPDELKADIALRLSDHSPRVRAPTARLVDQLNLEQATALMGSRLREETDRAVAAELLRIAARRPSREAVEAAIRWLQEPEAAGGPASRTIDLAAPAADAIWSGATAAAPLPDELRDAAAAALRARLAVRPSPTLVRSLVVVGSESDLAAAQELLDSPDAALRGAVAQGLAARGRADLLLSRAADPAIYPSVLKVLTNGSRLADLQRVAALPPPTEDLLDIWLQAIRAIMARLPTNDLLPADDALMAAAASLTLRAECLAAAVDPPPDHLSDADRPAIFVRLAGLWLELNQPLNAHELLEQLREQDPLSPTQAQLRFAVALRAGRFDRAAQLDNRPGSWTRELAAQSGADHASAPALRDEIARRFGDLLAGDVLAEYQAACERLRLRSSPVPPGAAAPDPSAAAATGTPDRADRLDPDVSPHDDRPSGS